MSDASDPTQKTNKSGLNMFREYFSSILAFVIVGAFLIMVGVTLPIAFNGSDEAFTRAKDLLTLVSPFTGMVIGYYFNKATSDARAENAEQNAKEATQMVQKATLDREKAHEEARKSEKEIQEMRVDLLEMWTAANDMIHEPTSGNLEIDTGLLRKGLGQETEGPGNKTMWKLQEALKRAEKWK